MGRRGDMLRVATAVGLALLVAGCGGRSSSSRGADGDLLGYYEVLDSAGIYVVGSMGSADKVKAGALPAKTVRRLNLQGQPVFIEADGAGLEYRLTSEYQRRHGLSQ